MERLIKEFRKEYENVYGVIINEGEFIFRELTRGEYQDLTEHFRNEYHFEESICETAILYPENYDFRQTGKAGLAKTLSAQILSLSGYAHPNQKIQMLEHYKNEMVEFDAQAETVISLVFQNVRFEEMRNWPQTKFMKYLARSEWVMRELWKIDREFKVIEAEETAPPTVEDLAAQVREQGGDPMFVLRHMIPPKPEYVDFPMIAGVDLLESEEKLNHVREHLQRLSE